MGGVLVTNPVQFEVTNGSASTTYYYRVAFVGTAISEVVVNFDPHTSSSTQNPAIPAGHTLGYAIGATVSGTMPDDSQNGIYELWFVDQKILGAGNYPDTLTIAACTDAACTHQISGSPQKIAVTYTVTGIPQPSADVTVSPNVTTEVASAQTGPASVPIIITAHGLPPTGAYVSWTASTNGLVTNAAYQSTLAPDSVNSIPGTIDLSLMPPSNAGFGFHTDSLQVNVCFDAQCSKPVTGSPWTVGVTYIVDPTAGTDYTQKTLNLSVAGLVWSSKTNRLYAAIPSYSAQYPGTLARIDPSNGTVETTIQLDGGVGHIEGGTLSISDDGVYLYVAISDAAGSTDHVERIRTADLGLDLQIALPAHSAVMQIKEAPATPHTVAILLTSPSPGLVIYDDAIVRGPALDGSSTSLQTSFTWGTDASTLYANLVQTVGSNTMITASTAAPGPSVTKSQTFGEIAGATGDLQLAVNRLTWAGGGTFDPLGYAPATAFGLHSSTGNTTFAAGVTFDATLNRAYFLTSDQVENATSNQMTLQGFDLTSQKLLWLARFPTLSYEQYVTRWGANGLAFVESSGGAETLVMISGALVTQ